MLRLRVALNCQGVWWEVSQVTDTGCSNPDFSDSRVVEDFIGLNTTNTAHFPARSLSPEIQSMTVTNGVSINFSKVLREESCSALNSFYFPF